MLVLLFLLLVFVCELVLPSSLLLLSVLLTVLTHDGHAYDCNNENDNHDNGNDNDNNDDGNDVNNDNNNNAQHQRSHQSSLVLLMLLLWLDVCCETQDMLSVSTLHPWCGTHATNNRQTTIKQETIQH